MAKTDRIEEIKRCLLVAEGDEHVASVHRWKAARLIYDEVRSGTSRRELGSRIGKSHTHVRYMYNCWDIVGRKLQVSGSPDTLPNFQAIYMSDEVRGDSGEEPDGGKTGSRRERRRRREDSALDTSAHGLVKSAAVAVNAIAQNPAYWPLLTDEDIEILRAIPPAVRAILHGER
jgi:hypothetical protein